MNNNFKQKTLAFYFFIFSLGLILTFICIDMIYLTKNTNNIMIEGLEKKAYEKELRLKNKFETSKNTLYGIYSSKYFQNFISNGTNKTELEELFLLIAKSNKDIMKIKYIDKNGLEKINISREEFSSNPIALENSLLQNKSNRYYFTQAKNKKETIWFSNIDLNVEHEKIETPYKPTLRAVLNLKKDDKFDGIVVINYFMKNYLDRLLNTSFQDFILIDEDGYILKHYDENKNWSFYSKNKETIKEQFPNTYKEILTTHLVKRDTFISLKLDFPTPKKLILITKMKDSFLEELKKEKIQRYLIVSVLVLLLSLIISFLFSKYLKNINFVLKDTQKQNLHLDEEVKEKTKELEDSQKRIIDIIDNITDFVWQVDEKGFYTYVSPQVKKILGYEIQELIGKTAFDLMDEKESTKVKKIFEHLVENKLPIKNLINKNMHKDGSEIWLETNANPIFDENGNLVGYRGTDRDITERKEQEEEIKKINAELKNLNKSLENKVKEEIEKNKQHEIQLFNQAKMAAMGDMLGNIAHQWRQPLSFISTTASGIKLNHDFNILNHEDLPHAMDEIVAKTQYLSQTIDTFRNFLMEKKEYHEIILQDRVEIALSIVHAALKDNHIYLEKVIDYTEPIKTKIVVGELSEVIINIINNAKDVLITREVPNPWIVVELNKEDDKAVLSIEDNAGGIKDEIITRIFEPYFTTKDLSVGTGLGLYMSYKIVKDSLNGNLKVENTQYGAKFTIELPLINS